MARSVTCVLMMMLFCGMAAAQGQPQSPLPAPTGPYAVGRKQLAWTDPSREDKDEPGGHRQLVVWIWYPATPKKDTERALWLPGKWADAYWESAVKRNFVSAETTKENSAAAIRTHSSDEAPLSPASKTYPVLLFEPGAGEIPLTYAALIEDVVSHGYVVVGIVPTGYTRFTVFPDGRVDPSDKLTPAFPPGSEKKTSDDQKPIPINGTTVYMTPEQIKALQDDSTKRLLAGYLVWAQDISFTISQMEKLNRDAHSPFKERLDFTRVGAFGHSLGGAASLQAAKDDARVAAAVDLDGRLFGTAADGGIPKPLLLLTEVSNPVFNAASSTGKPGYHLILGNSLHFFSADWAFLPFLSPKQKAQRVGSIEPSRALSITSTYVEAFFGKYLKGKATTLLSGPSAEYPEITFEPVK